MNKILPFSILSLLSLTGCLGALDGFNTTTKIVEYYQIRGYESFPKNHKSFPVSKGRNIFYCKLGFPGDPFINHVKYIEWNNKLIKIITEEEDHYIIKAKRQSLCCGCGDEILGPLNKEDYQEELIKIRQSQTLKNNKKFGD